MPKKQNLIYGKPLIPNAGIAAWYKAQLKGLVRYMTDKVSREVLKLYKDIPNAVNYAQDDDSLSSQERILLNALADEIEKLFKRKAAEIADRMISRQERYAKFSVKQSIGSLGEAFTLAAGASKTLNTWERLASVQEIIKAVRMENINLLRNLSNEYLMQIKGAVARSIINGQGQTFLKQEIAKFGGMTLRRAARIAKDQTHKAYNALSYNAMAESGIEYWQWVHGGGTKTVRETHIKEHDKGGLNHGVFKIGQKAYDPQAEKIKGVYRGKYIEPGELPFCSCIRRPVFKFD